MRQLAAFVKLSRLKFLFGGFAGFALGAAVAAHAGARVTVGAYVTGQCMVTAFHLMTHYANDYFDRAGDALGRPTSYSGGSGVLVSGALAPAAALAAALICAAAGVAVALYFAATSQPAAAFAGAGLALGAWCYSAPPLRLAARGWGELDAALVVAVLVPLSAVATFTGSVSLTALTATLAPAAAMFAMMIAVEWPDRAADAAAGKRNLIVRCGASAAGRLAAASGFAVVPALGATLAAFGPRTAIVLALVALVPAGRFAAVICKPDVPAVAAAARGVELFLAAVLLETLGYAAHWG